MAQQFGFDGCTESSQLGLKPSLGRTDGPPTTDYMGSQNADFNVVCRSSLFQDGGASQYPEAA
jgi:hypothetical protein